MAVGHSHSTGSILSALQQIDGQAEPIVNFSTPLIWPERLEEKSLYGIAGDFARAVAENSEADLAGSLVAFLTCAASLLGSNTTLKIDTNRQSLKLYAALVGDTTSRFDVPLQYAAELFAAAAKHGTKHDSNLAIKRGPLTAGEDLLEALSEESTPRSASKGLSAVPDNYTPSVLLCVEEFGPTLRSLQRTNSSLAPTLNSAWNSSDITIIGHGRKRAVLRAHVCLLGYLSLTELQELTLRESLRNSFASRILWVAVRRTKSIARPRSLDKQQAELLAQQLSSALTFANEAPVLRLARESVSLWDHTYSRLTQETPGPSRALTTKSDTQILRLAAIHALLDHRSSILPAHIEAAEALWRYCEASANLAFKETSTSLVASKILAALAKGPKTQTELYQINGRKLQGSELNSALCELQSRRLAVSEHTGGGPSKGRPTVIWRLGPGISPSDVTC